MKEESLKENIQETGLMIKDMEEAIEVIGLMIKVTGIISVKMKIEIHFLNILLLFQYYENYLIRMYY